MFSNIRYSVSVMALAGCLSAGAASGADATGNNDLDTLVDPTAPLTMSASPGPTQASLFSLLSTYKVTSILIRPNTKVAVINSRQVREGEMVGNAEVVRIEKNAVTLNVAGEERVLELYGRSIKTLNENQN